MKLPLLPSLLVVLLSAPAWAQHGPQPPLKGPAIPPAAAPGAGVQSHDLTPPDSASLIAGGGGIFAWLNVVNVPVSLDQAMTSDPVFDQGFANAALGTIIEVTFSGGVVNNVGNDVVMLDAEYDSGIYLVSADHDGFATKVSVDPATFYHATSYYYNGAGPYGASVYGAEIDLSVLGVPAGGVVHSLRFETTNSAGDPITLAKIGGFALSTNTLVAGTVGTASATGGTPSGQIGIAYSLTGTGPTAVNTGSCGVISVDLSPPINILTLGTADSNGDLSVSRTIPAGASGLTVYLQALDFGTCTLSNLVTTTIL